MRRWRRSTAGVSAAAAASTVREERPRYLLERSGSGKGGYSTLGDLQIKGGGARQGTVKGTAAGKATGLHLGQGGQGRLLEVGAPIDPELTADAEEGGDVGPLGAGAGTSLHRQSPPRAPAPGGRQAQRRRAPAAQELPLASAAE